ncbi:acetyl-CoA synthetase-like protein [Trametes elegans]|nr:acetyl-CoA synthetase-like protein [Trametes elegans]
MDRRATQRQDWLHEVISHHVKSHRYVQQRVRVLHQLHSSVIAVLSAFYWGHHETQARPHFPSSRSFYLSCAPGNQLPDILHSDLSSPVSQMPSSINDLVITAQQGANSTTWTRPELYGPYTVPELYAFHAEKSSEHPVMVYADEQNVPQELRYKEVFRGIRKAASIVEDQVKQLPKTTDTSSGNVVGILANADSITFLTLLVGVMYLGYTPFPLSVRNSAVGVANLVRQTAVRALLVSPDTAMQHIAQEAKEFLAKESYDIILFPLPQFPDLYNESDAGLDIELGPNSPEQPALIVHSSGSTTFPKPITYTHRNLTRTTFISYFGDLDLCGLRISRHGMPMFHMLGALIVPWVVCTGVVGAMFRPTSPPIMPTTDTILQAVLATKSDISGAVPAMIEAWARDPIALEALPRFKAILYAGAPLTKEVGEFLVDRNVMLTTAYGSTETGVITTLLEDPSKTPRDELGYFKFTPVIEHTRVYHPGLPHVFEPVLIDCPTWSPNAFNAVVDGRPAYAIGDLLEEHPRNPKAFRVYGRVDDQIVLSTGEKANPVPIEAILLQDPQISAAVIFGQGRFQNGVIVHPTEPFDPSDESKLEAFRNKIWPTVERANAFAPSHSRLFKEMIIVTTPGRPFHYTAKGTPRRHVSLADYTAEIEALYNRVAESSQFDVAAPESWASEDGVRTFVRRIVHKVMKAPNIGDEVDLFQEGCDSLQATYIRNTILHGIRSTTNVSTHDLPTNFVYDHPSVAALSTFLREVLSGKAVDEDALHERRIAQMKALVEKYGGNWPAPRWQSSPATVGEDKAGPEREVILITGTTGRLGSHLLAQSLQKSDVAHVYALNRGIAGEEETLAARQRGAFKTWGLDVELLSSDRVTFLPADLTKPSFGLEGNTYAEIRDSVTAIVHNGWRVDFNVTLPSFEPLVAGARNLLELALNSPLSGGPRTLFVSSISSILHYPADEPAPESLDLGPDIAVGMGYGESKWVAEQIYSRAAEATGLRTTSVRVGQLSGDTRIGGWSTTEWLPAIVRTAKQLGRMPTVDNTASWVPVDVAASALLEMVREDERVLHLVAPRPAVSAEIYAALAAQLGVPLVPAPEWLDELRRSAASARAGPSVDGHKAAHSLLPFFEGQLLAKEGKISTEKAVKVSGALEHLQPVSAEDAARWVTFWKAVGFLDD